MPDRRATNDDASVYPDEPQPRPMERLRCEVCGDTFLVYDDPQDGEILPDARAFLRRHRRCVRRVLDNGGTFAAPAPTLGRRRT
jgi:elongation factor P hydroxylase